MIIYTNRHPTKCANDLPKQWWKQTIHFYEQCLGSAHYELDGGVALRHCQPTGNTPSGLWVRSSKQHYDWLFDNLAQLLVLERKYGNKLEDKAAKKQRDEDTGLIMALLRSPHNLLNHGWGDPYAPDQKPYRKPAIDVHKAHVISLWNAGESTPTWPQGQPDWLQWDEENRKWTI